MQHDPVGRPDYLRLADAVSAAISKLNRCELHARAYARTSRRRTPLDDTEQFDQLAESAIKALDNARAAILAA